jgi:NAD(P)-dependent dehydrogenase (short-subunit alcohol dehydrogenase family)
MSVIRTVRLVVPSMRARGGGSILIGTSSSVKEPVPYLALSNVLRSGVTSLAKTLSVELAAEKIRVNTLIPDGLRRTASVNSTGSRRKGGLPSTDNRTHGPPRPFPPAATERRRVWPRRRVPALRRRVVPHGRVGAGRRRSHQGTVMR